MDSRSFDSGRIAEGYLKRPWLHKSVMEKVKEDCGMDQPFGNGLDVGCGAGLSTKALKLICDRVTGTDISEAMIEVCQKTYKEDGYSFYQAKAEETAIPENQYDIVTAAGVINWVERDKFLKNMSQVMEPGGVLIIYDFWITDQMKDREQYTVWYNEKYLKKFPKPPRKEDVWKQEDLKEYFVMDKQINYDMFYDFTMAEFIDFMMIQSNVNAKIENGEMTECEVRAWMSESLSNIFESQTRTLCFAGYNWYLKKIGIC